MTFSKPATLALAAVAIGLSGCVTPAQLPPERPKLPPTYKVVWDKRQTYIYAGQAYEVAISGDRKGALFAAKVPGGSYNTEIAEYVVGRVSACDTEFFETDVYPYAESFIWRFPEAVDLGIAQLETADFQPWRLDLFC
jgi:hypothetical protein